ncbi:FAD-binding protein [Clostridium sp. MCC353]|uniref:FAD-binding protein n=1 Tax=Clostridium sp. MCC353 TaxID=2592646 RepID=UPI00207A9C40|nr:FAD-binding protein [Clostridium sp. MCC353]MBT9777690.1 FAD-binding protein [Clostridium sp. MCC353]
MKIDSINQNMGKEWADKNGLRILDIHTIVVGSGAAGLNSADCLWKFGVRDMALVTERMNSGTSRNTGSDKQTYYKLSLSGSGTDSVRKLAQVLYGGGCVDGDHALCEAALSCQGFFKLVELGVPFPHDRYGEYVGYKTDHDPNDRGTSAGPYTSRYMTEALERNVRDKKIPIYDNFQVIRVLTHQKKLYGILCLDTSGGGFVLIRCVNVVYATGGPAGIYWDSVYPASQMGASGIAFEAGVPGKNLTEWQYGLASKKPRWNVSGSYMQVLPRFVSTDQEGKDEREFLMEFYDNREEMMNMVFLKGYQWPFDARKAAEGSSMIDLLVYRETCVRGRRVWLDYRSNPGGLLVDFDALSDEAGGYLKRSGACRQTPYERLCILNAPAVSFYKEHQVDLEKEMLEVAVCAQHNNGGLAVDCWWQTEVEGFFAVGEAAGTHGICRPGGSALNSGQVGSARAAEYIAAHREQQRPWTNDVEDILKDQVKDCISMGVRASACREVPNTNGLEHAPGADSFSNLWKHAVQDMSRYGAMMRQTEGMEKMCLEIGRELKKLAGAEAENGAQEEKCVDTAFLSRFYRYYDMRICQKVYLEAMLDYQKHGGRSRGSALYPETPEGRQDQVVVPELAAFTLDGPDGMAHEDEIQEIRFDRENRICKAVWRPVRKLEQIREPEVFEVVWKKYRENEYMERD